MKLVNKTRYAILGILLDGPSSGYDIKVLMQRSTVYFWRESDSTIYPMLKVLASEGKVLSEITYVGKKKKEIFSVTEAGQIEFREWFESSTSEEIPRNEFLLKFFFASDQNQVLRLFQERSEKVKGILEEYSKIEKRLENLEESARRNVRLKALKYGIVQLKSEIKWLKKEIGELNER
ncbi:MAG: PadR family transcriptional regulator [Chlamydiales bacterium]